MLPLSEIYKNDHDLKRMTMASKVSANRELTLKTKASTFAGTATLKGSTDKKNTLSSEKDHQL